MVNTSLKSSPDVVCRDVVAAFYHSLAYAPNRFTDIWNPDKMQFNRVAAVFRPLENFHVCSSAQSGFQRECFLSINQFAQFGEKKFSGFQRDGFRTQRRQAARDLVSVQETNHADARQK